jgi:hypothetical protein
MQVCSYDPSGLFLAVAVLGPTDARDGGLATSAARLDIYQALNAKLHTSLSCKSSSVQHVEQLCWDVDGSRLAMGGSRRTSVVVLRMPKAAAACQQRLLQRLAVMSEVEKERYWDRHSVVDGVVKAMASKSDNAESPSIHNVPLGEQSAV